jgi:regulator of protease activity HflC (stomatin/prohibitin superfamily)
MTRTPLEALSARRVTCVTRMGPTPRDRPAVTEWFKLAPQKLAYIHNNVPQPIEQKVVARVVASAFQRQPNYTVREILANRREEMVRGICGEIMKRLAADGIAVKEMMLRDVQLPPEYARGLEGLLMKQQQNESLSLELEVKQKWCGRQSLKRRRRRLARSPTPRLRFRVIVLQAKAQADARQHTLALKQKQFEQTRLEAEARAQAKLIDSKAELERRKLVTLGEADRIRTIASARCRADEDGSRSNEAESPVDPEDRSGEAVG